MKQRAGIARALAVQPELLLMDEPFSQVDALTAESLRAEVLDLWAAGTGGVSSILLVSHDIKEVAFMADRIVLMGARPGVVRTVIQNDLPRPRDYRSPELAALVDVLHDAITGGELPDREPLPLEPLPDATSGQIVGLLEWLDGRHGSDDVFRIASDTSQEFGHTIQIVQAAELLDLVDTPGRLVRLTAPGKRFCDAPAGERPALFRQQLLQLRLVKEVVAALERAPGRELSREDVLDLIVLRLPTENYERIFDRLVGWGRYAGLFNWDPDTEILSLAQ